jgi:hypothetical protein
MRIGRTTLAGVAGFAVMAVLAPAAWAAEGVTITQTDSPDPVDQGGTVTLQTTITNTGTAQSELRAHVRLARPGTQTAVDDQYVTLSPSQGNCSGGAGTSAAECVFGAVGASATVTINATVIANESFAQTVSAFRCTAPPQCDFESPLGSGGSITQVNYPTVFEGSSKIKLKGVPATCTNSSFKVKAKAKGKKVSRIYAYLKGPKTEFGTPTSGQRVSGRIAKKKGSKLKVTVAANNFDPGFYDLKIAAKQKGGKQLKRTATFQVCGSTFE